MGSQEMQAQNPTSHCARNNRDHNQCLNQDQYLASWCRFFRCPWIMSANRKIVAPSMRKNRQLYEVTIDSQYWSCLVHCARNNRDHNQCLFSWGLRSTREPGYQLTQTWTHQQAGVSIDPNLSSSAMAESEPRSMFSTPEFKGQLRCSDLVPLTWVRQWPNLEVWTQVFAQIWHIYA